MSDGTNNNNWMQILTRHLTTFIVIIGVMWVVAKPHAEEFIRKTVDDRLNLIEYKIDYLTRQINKVVIKLDQMEN